LFASRTALREFTASHRHPNRAALTGVALLTLLLTGTFFYARTQTYYRLMAKIADEHLIVPLDAQGIYYLGLHPFTDFRCTYNFWKEPFREKRDPDARLKNRYARLEFADVPPDLAVQLQVRVFADIPGLPDPAKTSVLTSGQIPLLGDSSVIEWTFHFGAVNFQAGNVLALRLPMDLHLFFWCQDQPTFLHAGRGVGAELGAVVLVGGHENLDHQFSSVGVLGRKVVLVAADHAQVRLRLGIFTSDGVLPPHKIDYGEGLLQPGQQSLAKEPVER
jgi:hypothetical protein